MTNKAVFNDVWQLLSAINESKGWLTGPVARQFALTPLQLRTLVSINHSDGLSLNELAGQMDMNNGNTSTLCKKLEANGFLIRERRKDDERFISLALTERGLEVITYLNASIEEQFSPIIDEVGDDTVQEMLTGLRALKKILTCISRKEGNKYVR